jgi:glycosyltransferase involved in cell wall biosynthesis
MAGVRAARLLGVPAVVTPFAHPGHWDDDVASAVAYRQADAVVAATAVDADAYRTLGVSDAKLHVRGPCSRGVDVPVDEGLRQERGINGPLILFLGSRRKHKGVDLLLESAALVRRERQDVTFAFVGPGPPLRTHERMGILDVGRVDDEERDRWLAAADLLCLPSAVESFGLVVLEAWSARTPVLVSDIPALKQLVEGTGGGVMAQRSSRSFAEAIVQLLAQPERLPAMGGAGWARWRSHHTPEANAAWHARLYESLQQHAGRSH